MVNAPEKWCDRLKKSLIEHGFTSCALDPCAFVLRMSGKIHGVLGVHVDDVIGGGDETFDRIMTAVRKEFDFGALDVGNFLFKGRQISQMPNREIVFDAPFEFRRRSGLVLSALDTSICSCSCLYCSKYPIPRRCWESWLVCGSLLSTVFISTCRIAPKTILTDKSRFVEAQLGDPHGEGD